MSDIDDARDDLKRLRAEFCEGVGPSEKAPRSSLRPILRDERWIRIAGPQIVFSLIFDAAGARQGWAFERAEPAQSVYGGGKEGVVEIKSVDDLT